MSRVDPTVIDSITPRDRDRAFLGKKMACPWSGRKTGAARRNPGSAATVDDEPGSGLARLDLPLVRTPF